MLLSVPEWGDEAYFEAAVVRTTPQSLGMIGGRDLDLNLDSFSLFGSHRTLISLSYLEDYMTCRSKMSSVQDTVDNKW